MRFTLKRVVLICLVALGACRSAHAQQNPILYCTQVPVSGFTVRSSAFGTHDGSVNSAPRGGDLMIRYTDGTTRNLTQEAGFGMVGFQGANAIAVREPCVHWSGTKALFSMVVGAPKKQYDISTTFYWQIYEVTGLGQGQTAQITKVPNQPAQYNNISPAYGSNGRIIFTSDRPRDGQRHLYPQRDEYESAPTVSGVWSFDPANGDLKLLTHTPSGAFSPIVDSFGRVIFTRWDHLQQDQQADADRAATSSTYGSFTYGDESAGAARLALTPEVFPEARSDNDPDNVAHHRSGNTFNLFMPWQINQDGTEEETVNHVGRHEFSTMYKNASFLNDPNLTYLVDHSLHANKTYIFGGDGGIFYLREDPITAGTYWGINAPEFATDGAGQIMKFTGAPTLNADQMVITAITDPVTRSGRADSTPATPAHVGLFRSPLPMSDGTLIAVHSPESRVDANEGTTAAPNYRYAFRLRTMTPSGTYYTPGSLVTAGTTKNVTWFNPDVSVTYNGVLWELDPVEVKSRPVPPAPTGSLASPEQQVFTEEGVNETTFRSWMSANQLALIVTRDNTVRDRADKQQPFNLRVPGGVSRTPASGKVYDIAHLQLVQADLIRGYGGTSTPKSGRRVLGQFMHEPAAANPANPNGPAGSVKLGADGSSAALVPAQRAMSWQLTDPAGEPIVRERNWITFQPGEIRTCAGCHGVNTAAHGGFSSPTNKPEALRTLLRSWKAAQAPGNPPAAPGHVATTTSSTTRAHISWRAMSGDETGFRVERGTSVGGPFVEVATVGADSFHFTDNSLTAGNTYYYRVTALNTNGASTATTPVAVIAGQAAAAQLFNISTRGDAGTGANTLIAGFTVVGGAPKRLLLRAVGPQLAQFGVSGFLADPELEVFSSGGGSIATNDNWSGADIVATSVSVGAFPLDAGSKDSATILDFAPGSYTVHVRPHAGSSGVALVEAYDASLVSGGDRLVNLSTRGRVGVGGSIMIPGFVVTGSDPKLVLIRGVGPSLATLGVPGVLADPVLTVYAGNTVIAQNDDWGAASNAAEIASESARVFAFPLQTGSKDAALLITLEPGAYTFHISGAAGSTGIALCEVYTVE